jgi:hypothetical protein
MNATRVEVMSAAGPRQGANSAALGAANVMSVGVVR